MRFLLTGSTGYVGKYLVAQILSATSHSLVLPIRPKAGKSAVERFQKEFCHVSLFGTDRLQTALQTRISVLEGDVAALKPSDLEGIDCIIHNAANVSFFDPIERLRKDNVDSMSHLCDLVQQNSSISRFLYISTCYVHPKDGSTGGKAVILQPGLSQERFINPYAYSKYLAEQELISRLRRIQPEILRLSIVGAPLGYFGAHPFKGAAHLSILTAIFQNRLSYVWIPNSVRLNILPVDSIVDEIVEQIEKGARGSQVRQLCAPPEDPAYHLSLKELSTFLKKQYSHLVHSTLLTNVETFEEFCSTVKGAPHLIELSLKANKVIHCVEHTPWFECSLEKSKLVDLTPEKHIQLTCQYVLRGIHEIQLKKGVPLTKSDKVLSLLENPTIHTEITVRKSLIELPKDTLKEHMYHAFCVDRKMVAVFKDGLWRHRGFVPQGSAVLETKAATKEEAYRWSYSHPIPLNLGTRAILFFTESNTYLTTIIQFNHMYMDGMGTLLHMEPVLEGLHRELEDNSPLTSIKQPRELSLGEDIWIGLKYGAWLLFDCIKQLFTPERPRVSDVSIATFQTPTKDIAVRRGMTFTESYLRDIVQTQEDSVRVCIPCNTSPPLARMKEITKNQTSLYYIDISKKQTDEEFRESFKVFRSMTAKWIALFLGSIVASWIPWLLKKCISSIDIIYTSLYTPNYKKDLEPNILVPVQEQQKLGLCSLTLEDTTFHTVVRRDGAAQQIVDRLQAGWAAQKL